MLNAPCAQNGTCCNESELHMMNAVQGRCQKLSAGTGCNITLCEHCLSIGLVTSISSAKLHKERCQFLHDMPKSSWSESKPGADVADSSPKTAVRWRQD